MLLRVTDGQLSLARYRHKDVPLEVTVCRFAAGMSHTVGARGKEFVITLLAGQVEIEGEVSVNLARKSVFRQAPCGVYVGPGRRVKVVARRASEFVILGCSAEGQGMVEVITAPFRERRGKRGYLRTVYHLVPEEFPAIRLLVGETINDPGNWSSFPPHKHDENGPEEVRMQEVYYFKIDPPEGFGLQRIYDDNGRERVMTIRHNDLVWIPGGYHPVTVVPGHRLYYLWALVGDGRRLKVRTDEVFRWLV